MVDLYERTAGFEGDRLKPYLDCCGRFWRECTCKVKGKLTIGRGRNLDSRGISAPESLYMYKSDIADAVNDINTYIRWAASELNEARWAVLVDLVHNMGIATVLKFRNMLAAMKIGDWERARDELLYQDPSKGNWEPNKYWLDVGDGPGKKLDRAEKNAKQLETGEWV